jgi:hypothetical protein
MSEAATRWRGGGCHCGAVRFEAALPDVVEAQTCNCSICAMTGFLHIIVPASRFRLAQGADHLTSYCFNTNTARHLFCDICGVKSFYRPRSNPDGWSLNAHCLDTPTAPTLTVTAFDGQNWERHGAELAHLSKEVP